MAVQREVLDPRGDIVLRLRCEVEPASPETHRSKRTKKVVATVSGASRAADEEGSPSADTQSASRDPEPAAETLEIVVSSKVLCLISPVFEALLTGPFRESGEFANASTRGRPNATRQSAGASIIGGPVNDNEASAATTDSLYTLDLPEDDPEAMTTLLSIAHFRPSSGLPGGLSEESSTDDCGTIILEKLALLCDKYQCLNVLGLVGQNWAQLALAKLQAMHLDPHLRKAEKKGHEKPGAHLDAFITNSSRLLVFCMVADLPETFATLCSGIIDHHIGPITSLTRQSKQAPSTKRPRDDATPTDTLHHALLPGPLAATLETERMSHCKRIYGTLIEPIQPVSKNRGAEKCANRQRALGEYVQAVFSSLPWDTDFVTVSLQGLNNRAQHALQKLGPTVHIRNCAGQDYTACECTAGNPFADKAKPQLEKLKAKLVHTICMDCLRTGGRSKQEKKCRVSH